MPTTKDLYTQWVAIDGAFDSSSLSNMSETNMQTNLSVRGKLVWLIHALEFSFDFNDGAIFSGGGASCDVALCTRGGLATMPQHNDPGVIQKFNWGIMLLEVGTPADQAVGLAEYLFPKKFTYMPPVPIAAGALSLYAQCRVTPAAFNDNLVNVRIAFTTEELDEKMYVEISEVWGW